MKMEVFLGLVLLGVCIVAFLFWEALNQPSGGGPMAGLVILLPIFGAAVVLGFLAVAAIILRWTPPKLGVPFVIIAALVLMLVSWMGYVGII